MFGSERIVNKDEIGNRLAEIIDAELAHSYIIDLPEHKSYQIAAAIAIAINWVYHETTCRDAYISHLCDFTEIPYFCTKNGLSDIVSDDYCKALLYASESTGGGNIAAERAEQCFFRVEDDNTGFRVDVHYVPLGNMWLVGADISSLGLDETWIDLISSGETIVSYSNKLTKIFESL